MKKKRYWRDAGWFIAGTFLGGIVLNFFGGIFGGLTKKGG